MKKSSRMSIVHSHAAGVEFHVVTVPPDVDAESVRSFQKYATIRTMLTDIFNSNHLCYGYHRLHAMLRHEGRRLSEKLIRRLMVEEQLVVIRNRHRRYSSYCGEIGPVPDNLIARDFKAEQPNILPV